jgi:hypothetical protein
MEAQATQKGNARSSGYDRHANDWYVESAGAVDALLNVEQFDGPTLDPACGGGNIPLRFQARGLWCFGSDIIDRGFGQAPVDFLHDHIVPALAEYRNIVTNPPFAIAQQFVERALSLVPGKVAIIQRLAFLEGQERGKLFRRQPPTRVWVFSSRQSMPPGGTDIPAQNGSVAYCWLVWDRLHVGKTELGWLP